MKERESFQHSGMASRLRILTGLSITLACLLLWLGGAVFGYARAGGSTTRSLTTPPSNDEEGLIARPDPVDNNGNLMITGNVAGGKHFRGRVPYRSTTSIDAPLGSTSLDSFMRATEPVDLSDDSQEYQPYYSLSGTATTLQPGPDGRSVPVTASEGAGARAYNEMSANASTPSPTSSSLSPRADSSNSVLTPGSDEYEQQLQELRRRLGMIQAGADQLSGSVDRDTALREIPVDQPNVPSRRDALLQETARLLSSTLEPSNTGTDVFANSGTETQVYQGAGLRLYDPQRDAQVTLDAALAAPRRVVGALPGQQPAQRIQNSALPEPTHSGALPSPTETPLPPRASAATVTERNTAASAPVPAPIPPSEQRLADSPVETNARSPLPSTNESATSTTLQDFTLVGSNGQTYLREGQSYLKQGQYRPAAQAFTSALAYNPNDAQAHLGRFQALFGASEFSDSTTSLIRAIELDPVAALQKADLVTISGGPDAFILLYNDLAQQAAAGDAPRLQFLLAYIYYQMDQRDLARMAVRLAEGSLSGSGAVGYLKAVITQ